MEQGPDMNLRIVLDQRDMNDLKQGAAINRAGKFKQVL